MNDLLFRADFSRNLDGTPSGTRNYGSGVVGKVWITFGSGKLDHSWGVFGTRYQYRYSAQYEWTDSNGKRQKVFLSGDYYSESSAWEDVDKFATRQQRDLVFR